MTSILDFITRPKIKQQQDAKEVEEKRKQGNFFVRNAKWFLLVFANGVALFFDALAVDGVWTATHDYVLSALIMLPTGVPLVLWELGWLYPLASPEQKQRAIRGITQSVISAILIGVASIVVILKLGGDYPLFFMLACSVGFVISHGFSAAKFFYSDPIIKQDHELQVFNSENDYQKSSIEALNAVLDSLEPVLEKEQRMRAKFGDDVVNAGFERLMNIKVNVEKHNNQQGKQNQPASKPQQVYASDEKQETLRDNHKDPTNPPRQ